MSGSVTKKNDFLVLTLGSTLMVDAYDGSEQRPNDDKEIVKDPNWHKIRDFAKLVYEEITNE